MRKRVKKNLALFFFREKNKENDEKELTKIQKSRAPFHSALPLGGEGGHSNMNVLIIVLSLYIDSLIWKRWLVTV